MARFGRKQSRKVEQKAKAYRDAVRTDAVAQVAAILANDCVPKHLAHAEAKRLLGRTMMRMRQEQQMAKEMGVAAGTENTDLHATILQREILALIANWRARTGMNPIDPKVLEKFGIQIDDRYKAVVDITRQQSATPGGESLIKAGPSELSLAPSAAAEAGAAMAEEKPS